MTDFTANILGMVTYTDFNLAPASPSRAQSPAAPDDPSSFAAALKAVARPAATGSVHDIVMSAADRYADLLDMVNASTSYDERLANVRSLTEEIAADLRSAGHEAYVTGSPDKVVIDGELWDIVFASKGVGETARMQMLDDGSAAENGIVAPANGTDTPAMDAASAIFHIGASLGALLSGITGAASVDERRALGAQLQSQLVQGLTDLGFSASALDSPDKISINGTTYDVIRGLNELGGYAQLQVLRV